MVTTCTNTSLSPVSVVKLFTYLSKSISKLVVLTYNCFFREQMKALYQATVYESTYRPNVIMFHHVVPNAKAMVSVTWRIPIICTRSLMSKIFRPVTITCPLPNPEIWHRRSYLNVRV